MDIKEMDQGLLKRNPSMTQAQFSDHWLTKHAPLVVPFFLHSGITHYEQIHGPLATSSPQFSSLVAEYDGAAGIPAAELLAAPRHMEPWKQAYYQEVILVDERRFLVSEALAHIKRVPPQTVKGERKVVIERGKCLIEVSDEIWGVWREYEARGNVAVQEGK